MREIINHFGEKHQIEKVKEELQELIDAINKKDPDNILEEMADCIIMIKQLQIIYKFTNEQIDEQIDFKMDRTHNLIRGIKEGKIIDIKGETND